MKYTLLPASLLAALLLSACTKDDPDPASQLPPATQTGANTFGCLVNGQAWTPQGYSGFSNYIVSYDTFSDGGLINISAYRIYGSGTNDFQSISLWTKSISGIGTFSFRDTLTSIAQFSDYKSNCIWRSSEPDIVYRQGTLTLSRLDLRTGVISGTFEFTLAKPGCDTIKVTQGRFDRKL